MVTAEDAGNSPGSLPGGRWRPISSWHVPMEEQVLIEASPDFCPLSLVNYWGWHGSCTPVSCEPTEGSKGPQKVEGEEQRPKVFDTR